MPHSKPLAIVNLVLAALFAFLFIWNTPAKLPVISVETTLDLYLPSLIFLLSAVANGILAFQQLAPQQTQPHTRVVIASAVFPLIWFSLLLFGHFFGFVAILFSLLLLVISPALLLWRLSKKSAAWLACVSVLTIMSVCFFRIRELYCWEQVDATSHLSQQTVTVTQEDEVALQGLAKAGDEIGAGVRALRICYQEFDLREVLRKTAIY
jgi:hypothetical protein